MEQASANLGDIVVVGRTRTRKGNRMKKLMRGIDSDNEDNFR